MILPSKKAAAAFIIAKSHLCCALGGKVWTDDMARHTSYSLAHLSRTGCHSLIREAKGRKTNALFFGLYATQCYTVQSKCTWIKGMMSFLSLLVVYQYVITYWSDYE